MEDGLVANPAMLVLAREAAGLTQARLAAELTQLAQPEGHARVSQGYVSRAESGDLAVSGDRLRWFVQTLGVRAELLTDEARVWALGDGCIYHRRRAHARVNALRRLHARLNLIRLAMDRLRNEIGRVASVFNLPTVEIGGAVSPGDAAQIVRDSLGTPTGPVRSMTELIEKSGALVLRIALGSREVDAASLHPPGESPLFVINSDAPADRQRFTLAHELGHTIMRLRPDADAESASDQFASELLMPAQDVRADLKETSLNLPRLRQLKARWRVSAAALARRANDLAIIDDTDYRRIVIEMSRLGWRTTEPEPIDADIPTAVPSLVLDGVATFGSYEQTAHKAGVLPDLFAELVGTDVPIRPNPEGPR